MTAAIRTPELVNLRFHDWQGTRTVHLDSVPRSTTVGHAVAEAVRALELPFTSSYKALWEGRELNYGETLDELGIETDQDLELVPEVSAG